MRTFKLIFAIALILCFFGAWINYANTQTDLRIGTALKAARNF